ncbi:MAG TPA: hypothetical protein VF037_08535 [Gemmatimonadales bacterium]
MRCWWWTGSLALALAAGAGPIEAQSGAERRALDAFRDSLLGAPSTAALNAIPPEWSGGVAPGLARLRRGFHWLARGRLSGRRGDLDRALIELDWAVTAERQWPYAWFGRGLAKLALSEAGFRPKPMAGMPPGRNFYQGFTSDLIAAFERDSLFAPGVELLAELLPPQGNRSQPVAFVRALERAAANGATNAAVHLVLGRAYRAIWDDERALAAFDAYLAAGGDPGTAALERARSLAGLGRLDAAAEAYLRGVTLDATETRAHFRRDLAWVATDSELTAFDALPPELVGRWVSDFWALRDAENLRRPGERLREHLRRWNYAHRRFRVVEPERKTDYQKVMFPDIGACLEAGPKSLDNLSFEDPSRLADARRRERMLDHRGIVYIRHGEPAARLRAPGEGEFDVEQVAGATATDAGHGSDAFSRRGDDDTGVMGRVDEVWQYWIAGDSRIFYFSGSLPLGRTTPSTLYPYVPLRPALLYRVAALDARYLKVARAAELQLAGMRRAGPIACMAESMRLRRETRTAMETSVRTDTYSLLFPEGLDPIVQAAAVGDPAAGQGRLLLVYAIPGERLVPSPLPDGRVTYPIAMRLTAIDRAHHQVRGIDSLRTFVVRDSIRAGSYLTGLLELPLPAGAYEVRVALHTPDEKAGSALELGTVDLGAPAGTLGMSDLLLEADGGGLRWSNRGEPVMLNALNAYRPGDAAPVYYEAFGMVPGRTYETTLSVRRAGDDDGPSVSVVFSETADRPSAAFRRTIGLENIDRGQYRLALTILEKETGTRVSRSRLINVVQPVRSPSASAGE